MNTQILTPDVLRLIARKMAVPLVLLVLVGGGVHYLTGEMERENVQLQFVIASMDYDISQITERIATIDQELGVIREKGRRYDEILLTGFAAPQQRLRANQLVEELSRKHHLAEVTYNFNPETVHELRGESGVDFLLSQTDVTIDIKGYTDYDITGFVAEFAQRLEGQVQIYSLRVIRNSEITDELVQQIAIGATDSVFSGALRLQWNNVSTVAPEISEEEQAQ